MAYNFFDLGIKGPEVKRRLDMFRELYLTSDQMQKRLGSLRDDVEEGDTVALTKDLIYTNTEPLLNDVGGIKANAHPEGFSDTSITDLLTELLYPYTKPVIDSFALTPAAGVKKKGESFSLTAATAKITKKSKTISKVDLYKGSTVIETISGPEIQTGTTITFSELNDDVAGTENVTYTVKVSEENGAPDVVTKSATYTFVDPYYCGIINKDAEINDTLVTSLTEKVESKGTKSYAYTTTTEQCSVIAYPKSYGELKSIKDPNGFTQTWTKVEITINNVAYYVYVSNAAEASDFYYTFTY